MEIMPHEQHMAEFLLRRVLMISDGMVRKERVVLAIGKMLTAMLRIGRDNEKIILE